MLFCFCLTLLDSFNLTTFSLQWNAHESHSTDRICLFGFLVLLVFVAIVLLTQQRIFYFYCFIWFMTGCCHSKRLSTFRVDNFYSLSFCRVWCVLLSSFLPNDAGCQFSLNKKTFIPIKFFTYNSKTVEKNIIAIGHDGLRMMNNTQNSNHGNKIKQNHAIYKWTIAVETQKIIPISSNWDCVFVFLSFFPFFFFVLFMFFGFDGSCYIRIHDRLKKYKFLS